MGTTSFDSRTKPHPIYRMSKENLTIFEANPSNFVKRFVTIITINLRPRNSQKNGSIPSHQSHARKAKVVPSAGKVMASIFWDAQGVLLVDYLKKGCTINGQYYSDLLKQLRETIKKKRHGMIAKRFLVSPGRIHQWLQWQPFMTVGSN